MDRRRVAGALAVVAAAGAAAWLLARGGPVPAGGPGASRAAPDRPPPSVLAPPALAGRPRGTVADAPEPRPADAAPGAPAPVSRGDASLAADLDFGIDVVDATTGRALAATWLPSRLDPETENVGVLLAGLALRRGLLASAAGGRGVDEEIVRLEELARQIDERLVARWEQAWHPATDVCPLSPTAGSVPRTLEPRIAGPAGFVSWQRLDRTVAVAAGVRHLRARIPLHRALTMSVTVLGPDERPALGARVVNVRVGDRAVVEFAGAVDAQGVVRCVGIPFLPGEAVVAGVLWSPDPSGSSAQEPPPVPFEGGREDVRTVVPDDPSRPWDVVVRLTGPVEEVLDRDEFDCDLPVEDSLAKEAPPSSTAVGRIRARALGPDGRPIPGQALTCAGKTATTDADGFANFDDAPVGPQVVRLAAIGRWPAEAEVVVRAGAAVDADVREARGATLDVLVDDGDGHPWSHARVEVRAASGQPAFDVDGDTQRVDPFTDERGRRSFARVPPGSLTVAARWGSLRGDAPPVEAVDGGRVAVHVVLRRPAPPAPPTEEALPK